MAEKKKAASAKGRKLGRNRKWCEAYRLRNQRLTNKIKKLRRHIKRFAKDKRAVSALKRLAG